MGVVHRLPPEERHGEAAPQVGPGAEAVHQLEARRAPGGEATRLQLRVGLRGPVVQVGVGEVAPALAAGAAGLGEVMGAPAEEVQGPARPAEATGIDAHVLGERDVAVLGQVRIFLAPVAGQGGAVGLHVRGHGGPRDQGRKDQQQTCRMGEHS